MTNVFVRQATKLQLKSSLNRGRDYRK